MSETRIVIEGDEELARALQQTPRIAKDNMERFLTKSLLYLGGVAADYPPPPPNSTYVRTGTLGRLWTSTRPDLRLSATAFEGRLGNATPYAPEVQSEAEQRAVHAGRWKTIEDIMRDERSEIEKFLRDTGQDIVRDVEREARR